MQEDEPYSVNIKKKKAMGSSLRWGKKYQLKRGEVR